MKISEWLPLVKMPLFWKFMVVVLGYLFAILNQFFHPSDLITFPQDTSPYSASIVRAAGFALITAIALFAGLIPTSRQKDDVDKELDPHTFVDYAARMLGVLGAFGAGWYSLDSATQGNSGPYIYAMATLAGFAILAIAIGGGFWAALLAVLNWFFAGLDAAILLLKTAILFIAGKLRRKQG